MKRPICLACGILFFVGCGAPFGVESDELPLVLTLPEYATTTDGQRDEVTIDFEVVNRTDRTLYVRYSCSVIVQRLDAGEWVHQWGGRECLLGLEDPSFLAAGEPERRQISPRLDEPWPDAEYRLLLEAMSDDLLGKDLGPNVPLELRVSEPFRVIPR